MENRIRRKELLKKVMSAEKAAMFIKDGMNVGISGFTPSGYPKVIPRALAERAKKEKFKINLWSGASTGDKLDGVLARAGVINRRLPYQNNKSVKKGINDREIIYTDIHLSKVAQYVRCGFLGPLHIAIVEAVAITPEGNIIPSTSLGNSSTYVQEAEKVIVELNINQPLSLEGMHDIYTPKDPPNCEPIPLCNVNDRIGTPYIPCDPKKIVAIVITDERDEGATFVSGEIDNTSMLMANNLINFLKDEVKKGFLPDNLLPIQSGVGSVANAVLAGLINSDFSGLRLYSEVLQDSVLDLIDKRKVDMVSCTALTLSPEGFDHFFSNINQYHDKIVIRPQEISNSLEIAKRLGLIAINTAIEADIFGNVNSTHIMGKRMMNGIGGAGDFSRSAYLSIFCTASTIKNGTISCIVPMVSHVDHTEHEVNIIVTEQGVADLRNKNPLERAKTIIENCAHPDYRPLLNEYLNKGLLSKGHTPLYLPEAFSWYLRFQETNSMLPVTKAGKKRIAAK
ncbi:MAG: succinyl-CoA:acetate CoA-transferase [Clostridia bacterium]|nr:succinyl-CoA:acetate CoA-transferase [Clostridia bacterium]